MSAPVNNFRLGKILNEEGEAYLLELGWESPSENAIYAQEIIQDDILTRIFHDPCGKLFRSIQLSENKRVLVCDNCFLRLEVPLSVVTVEDFRKFIVS